MQIKRRIEWWAACLRGGEVEDGSQERSSGVRLGFIVFLAPVNLAINHLWGSQGKLASFTEKEGGKASLYTLLEILEMTTK